MTVQNDVNSFPPFQTARHPIMTIMYNTKQTANSENFNALAIGPQRHLFGEFCDSNDTEPSWPNFVSSIFAPIHGKHFSMNVMILIKNWGGGSELSNVASVRSIAATIRMIQVMAKLKLQNFTEKNS